MPFRLKFISWLIDCWAFGPIKESNFAGKFGPVRNRISKLSHPPWACTLRPFSTCRYAGCRSSGHLQLYFHDFYTRVMPFPQTSQEVCWIVSNTFFSLKIGRITRIFLFFFAVDDQDLPLYEDRITATLIEKWWFRHTAARIRLKFSPENVFFFCWILFALNSMWYGGKMVESMRMKTLVSARFAQCTDYYYFCREK